MSVESIIEGLKDVEEAFEKLSEAWDMYEHRFTDPLDDGRFRARKQEYKDLRDQAVRWIRTHGAEPEWMQDLERGWYTSDGTLVDDALADVPFTWSVHAFRMWKQLERVSAAFAPQNIYIINL